MSIPSLKDLVEFLNIRPPYLLAIAATCGTILFCPDSILSRIGLAGVPAHYLPIVGIIFLLSSFAAFATVIVDIVVYGRSEWRTRSKKRRIEAEVRELDSVGKVVLRRFIEENRKCREIHAGTPTIVNLVELGWIKPKHGMKRGTDFFTIDSLVWDVIKGNPNIVATAAAVNNSGKASDSHTDRSE